MGAHEVIFHLARHGITIDRDGENLVVKPASRLSAQQRALILRNKPDILALLTQAHATSVALIKAIRRTCDHRGDDDANRRALIEECGALDPASQADQLEHFQAEAERWARATGAASDARHEPQ